MIDSLHELEPPDWLRAALKGRSAKVPPLPEILQDSLFYPAAGFDGRPIRFLAGKIFSFVYADYGIADTDLAGNVKDYPPAGYEVVSWQPIRLEDLGLASSLPRAEHRGYLDDRYENKRQSWAKDPFCDWLIFRRKPEFTSDHGPIGFSLLYFGYEAVAAFEALYVHNDVSPAAIAIIQPGTGFNGGNWTNFCDPDGPLAKRVLENPAGCPRVLLYGGVGGRDFYQETCWPRFTQSFGFLGGSPIHAFGRA